MPEREPYPQFDRGKMRIRPLAEREHDLTLEALLPLDGPLPPYDNPDLAEIAQRIVAARRGGHPVILMMGAHVIRSGLSRQIIDLMERGLITHVAGNGACAIHDWELALIGATTESVARYIRDGSFGNWAETGQINDVVSQAARGEMGLGEAVGEAISHAIAEGEFPHKEISILAAGYRLRVPVTIHVGIGYDIIHQHPNCDGAALGAASYRDFLIFAEAVNHLEGGVFLNYGTAVMGPEVYLKALSMARNVAAQEGREIRHFTTAVFDLQDLGEDYHQERPKSDPLYYYRPFKTILVRTVQDGGKSYYVRGPHRATFPHLHQQILAAAGAAT